MKEVGATSASVHLREVSLDLFDALVRLTEDATGDALNDPVFLATLLQEPPQPLPLRFTTQYLSIMVQSTNRNAFHER